MPNNSLKDESRKKHFHLNILFLGCLAVATNGEISCSQCQAAVINYCEYKKLFEPTKACASSLAGRACKISCNDYDCQEFASFICSVTPDSDACLAAAGPICLNNNRKGKSIGEGKGNHNGEISCSQCQAIIQDSCELSFPPERVDWCLGIADIVCQVPCNDYQCPQFSAYLCSRLNPVDAGIDCFNRVVQACRPE